MPSIPCLLVGYKGGHRVRRKHISTLCKTISKLYFSQPQYIDIFQIFQNSTLNHNQWFLMAIGFVPILSHLHFRVIKGENRFGGFPFFAKT